MTKQCSAIIYLTPSTANTDCGVSCVFMQAGFMCLEAGFARNRESVNIILEGIVDTCLCGLLFWAWGFAFMFCYGNPWIGLGTWDPPDTAHHYNFFFLANTPATYGATGVPVIAFWLFQFAFADTYSTITSGAMLGRTGFVGDLLYSFGVSGFIYPIIGHWAWGPDGWLATMGSKGHSLCRRTFRVVLCISSRQDMGRRDHG